MSIKSKIAAIAAASIGMVLTQSSASRAETKIAAPVDIDEIFYSAVPDEVLEKAAAFGGNGACYTVTCAGGQICTNQGQQGQTVKKPPYWSKNPTRK